MANYTVHQAKTNLSKLLRRAASGEQVVIVDRNRPIARLVPYRSARLALLGDLAGKITIGKDFDLIPESFEHWWEGGSL